MLAPPVVFISIVAPVTLGLFLGSGRVLSAASDFANSLENAISNAFSGSGKKSRTKAKTAVKTAPASNSKLKSTAALAGNFNQPQMPARGKRKKPRRRRAKDHRF